MFNHTAAMSVVFWQQKAIDRWRRFGLDLWAHPWGEREREREQVELILFALHFVGPHQLGGRAGQTHSGVKRKERPSRSEAGQVQRGADPLQRIRNEERKS